MPVALIATAVTAGASIYSANKQSKAAKNASNQAAATASEQIALQREAYDNADRILTPYSTEGNSARRMYNAAIGVAPTGEGDTIGAARSDYDAGFDNSPFWRDAQYATGQAMNALQSTNAAMGRGSSINSGKALRAASDIQEGYRGSATQNYLNSLAGVAGTGFQADTGRASGGQNFANAASNALAQSSALQGQYAMQGAQAWGNAASDIAGLAGYVSGNYRPGGQNYFRAPSTSGGGGFNWAVQPVPTFGGGG
jgi:hypothetical protein